MAEPHTGIHFRTNDGSVYFIRDQVLEACKLSGEELQGAEKDLERGEPVITDSVYIERDMPPLEFSAIGEETPREHSVVGLTMTQLSAGGVTRPVASTIMCCW